MIPDSHRRDLPALLLVGLLAAACGEAGGTSGLEATVDTTGGARTFVYPGEGGAVLPWRTDTVTLIGAVMSDDDAYQFDQVRRNGLAGDGAGGLYLLDGSASRVLYYGLDGRHRGTWGRPGEGPGELGLPVGLTVGPGDTVWVLDLRGPRLTGFPTAAGGEPRTIPLPASGGLPTGPLVHTPGGFLLQQGIPLRLGGGSFTGAARGGVRMTAPAGGGARVTLPAPSSDSADQFVPIMRIAGDGTVTDTIWKSPPPQLATSQIATGGNMMVVASAPTFAPTLRWATFADGGIVVSETDRYELSVVRPDGQVQPRISRTMPPWPVTDAEKEFAREQARKQTTSITGMPPEMVEQIQRQRLESMTFAETVPRIAGLAVDDKDRIWVGVSVGTPGAVDRVDLFSRDGEFLGSLNGIPIPDVFLGDGHAASLFRDPDTDVQRVAVYRLIEATPRS